MNADKIRHKNQETHISYQYYIGVTILKQALAITERASRCSKNGISKKKTNK